MIGRWTALAGALMLTMLSGCATSSWSAQPGEPPACPADVTAEPVSPIANRPRAHASGPPNHGELSAIADVISQLGQTRFRSVYAGLAINTDEDRVDVWSKKSAEFAAEINVQPWAARVRMYGAPYSFEELDRMHYRVLEDYDYWKARGLPLVQSGIRHEGTYIEIGTPDPVRAKQEFAQRYPGAPFCYFTRTERAIPFGRG